MDTLFSTLLRSTNEIITAATVVMAASLLLYNLTRNLRNRVARSSGTVLACVTLAYIFDVFLALGPDATAASIALRLQWIGVAIIPAAMFHLSDALLATTGLPSRGRRRRIVRIFYFISIAFLSAATLTNLIIIPTTTADGTRLAGGAMLWLFMIYFFSTNIAAFINVQRARTRCLTRSTQRRMLYLQLAFLTPALAIFPYSVLLPASNLFSLDFLLVVNIANIFVLSMLIFLSYPLSFFGSDAPDRVVKSELLRFLLRGPATGLLALATIVFTVRATEILGLAGQEFMPFAVVSAILMWQWTIALALPYLERWLIYSDEDSDQIARLQHLSDRLLTYSDLLQLIEATLEATCDYLRVTVAFVASLQDDKFEILRSVGRLKLDNATLNQQQEALRNLIQHKPDDDTPQFQTWGQYQIMPLYSHRTNDEHMPIGFMGIRATPEQIASDEDVMHIVYRFMQRTEQTLDDMLLQSEVVAALEGLLPQISSTRDDEIAYRPGRKQRPANPLPPRDEAYEQVRAALRHYWGGPGIARSRLLEFEVVHDHLNENDTPVNALRSIIEAALNKIRPDGEQSMVSPEWTLYNIIDMRFVQGKKVREVANRMSMSEADLYRKQRIAIEAITDSILNMERDARNGASS